MIRVTTDNSRTQITQITVDNSRPQITVVSSEQIEEGRRHLRKEASEDVVAVAANDLRQFGILVCDNLRQFYKRLPWLIAGQQLVPARFRLQKLSPNLADYHG